MLHYTGPKKTRTYRIWGRMFARCYNPLTRDYRWYGALGVKIADRWRSFENFLADMGECPEGLTIDRIDPTGNYEPGNCRWATWTEQRHNRRAA